MTLLLIVEQMLRIKACIKSKGLNINYYGFEPEEPTYKCLSLNVGDTSAFQMPR